jgi:hypothetical protein
MSIAGIAGVAFGSDQLGRLEGAGPGQGGPAVLQRGVDHAGVRPAELTPGGLLEKRAFPAACGT